MKEIIAMHGWGGDSNTWAPWISHFTPSQWRWKSGERGYGQLNPHQPNWTSLDKSTLHQRRVVIGHSLGPHLINKEILANATDVIFLCSFGRFISQGNQNRSIKIALKGMKDCLGTVNEIKMFESFLIKACHPYPINVIPRGPLQTGLSNLGRKKLKADLELLIKTDGIPHGLPNHAKVLVIDAEDDEIVSKESKAELLADLNNHLDFSLTHWRVKNAGHSLAVPNLISRVHNWLEMIS